MIYLSIISVIGSIAAIIAAITGIYSLNWALRETTQSSFPLPSEHIPSKSIASVRFPSKEANLPSDASKVHINEVSFIAEYTDSSKITVFAVSNMDDYNHILELNEKGLEFQVKNLRESPYLQPLTLQQLRTNPRAEFEEIDENVEKVTLKIDSDMREEIIIGVGNSNEDKLEFRGMISFQIEKTLLSKILS